MPQNQDGDNISAIVKTMRPSDYYQRLCALELMMYMMYTDILSLVCQKTCLVYMLTKV